MTAEIPEDYRELREALSQHWRKCSGTTARRDIADGFIEILFDPKWSDKARQIGALWLSVAVMS